MKKQTRRRFTPEYKEQVGPVGPQRRCRKTGHPAAPARQRHARHGQASAVHGGVGAYNDLHCTTMRVRAERNGCSDQSGDLAHQNAQGDGIDILGQAKFLVASMNDEPARRFQILARDVESLRQFWRSGSLNLYRPDLLSEIQHQVDLGSGRSSIEVRSRQRGMTVATFSITNPSQLWISKLAVMGWDLQQGMQNAGIADIDPRRFDKAFSDICMRSIRAIHQIGPGY